ncbi:MAG: FAD:protein FMN transferase [Bernardetiaceae bacterium]|nr:FAD:protein FMN transferase [Bernardetiaceae bacterium]
MDEARKNYYVKNSLYAVIVLTAMLLVYLYREYVAAPAPRAATTTLTKEQPQTVIKGETMGTYYDIRYVDTQNRYIKNGIDSLLFVFNQSLSTYISDSEISRFNREDSFAFELPYFYPMLRLSREIHKQSGGAFEPTIMPLVNAWGFGPAERQDLDSAKVDSLLALVDFTQIIFDEQQVSKAKPNMSLDFSAIAKGYGVDVVAEYLETYGITNYKVEIGGEVRCKGVNSAGDIWRIGIEQPSKKLGENIMRVVSLENSSMATSGNYRNYYEKDGVVYSHTLDPRSGYPVRRSIISSTIIASDCATADAWATVAMVVGAEKAYELISALPGLEGLFVYLDDSGAPQELYTDKMRDWIE